MSKTINGGQITCVDAVAFTFNGLTIAQSVTIDCIGTGATTDHISIDSPDPGAVVILRGLTFYGYYSLSLALPGLAVARAQQVVVDNCRFSGFGNNGANRSIGILFAPSGSSRFAVLDSSITINGDPGANGGGGIVVRPTGSGSARVAIERVNVTDNVFGIVADGSASTGGIAMLIADSIVSGNGQDGIVATTPPGGAPIGVMIKNTSSFSNTIGIRATGPGVTVRADGVTVANNGSGLVFNNGAALLSYGNNNVDANGVNGSFSGQIAVK